MDEKFDEEYNSQDGSNNEEIPEEGNFRASPKNEQLNGFKNNFNPLKQNPISNNGFNKKQFNNSNIGKQNAGIQNPANKVKQEAIAKGAKAAANAVAGPLAGAAVEALAKSELAQKALNTASNNLSNNSLPTNNLMTFSPFKKKKKKSTEEEGTGDQAADITKKIIGFGVGGTFGFGGCLTGIIIIVLVAIIISPLFYVNELVNTAGDALSSFGEKLGNFLTFRGWCSDEECQENEQFDFYNHIDEVYEEYVDEKGVKLNVTLLTATLTYADPFTTIDDEEIDNFEDLVPSNYLDFKKSEKKVDELAARMVSYCCYKNGEEYLTSDGKHMCRRSNKIDYSDINYACPDDVYKEIDGEEVLVEDYEEKYKLDIDRYEEYLREEFIRKFYYDNKDDENTTDKVNSTVNEIFARVAMYEDYNNTNVSNNFTGNNTIVTILDCNNGIVIDQVTLYEYLQGVLYVEGFATGRSEEFLKVMAIAAKNYLYALNGATPNSIPRELRIKSCAMNQIFCNVTEGCHNWSDGNSTTCSGGIAGNCDTIASGPDENGNYYRAPLQTDSETLKKIKNAVDATLSEFIINNGVFVPTQYRSSCSGVCDSSNNIMDQERANEMINSGSSYKEVLNYFYNGSIEKIVIYASGYPLDLDNTYVTSAFGWRVHPINKCCRHHNGTDIGADYNDNIYAIADGVVIVNGYDSSYGNYIIIGHGTKDETTGYYEYYSLYAHQIRLSKHVEVGDKVNMGQLIGNVGSTGASTGPHLHIEIYKYVNGKKVRQDPVETFQNVELTGMVGGAIYDSEAECGIQGNAPSCS